MIDCMISSREEAIVSMAEVFQTQIIYNGEILEIAVDSLRSYKDGIQSLRYLDSSVDLAYSLLRMLERWAKRMGSGQMYVKKKARRKRKGKDAAGDGEEEAPPEESDKEDMIQESLFSFETFEAVWFSAFH